MAKVVKIVARKGSNIFFRAIFGSEDTVNNTNTALMLKRSDLSVDRLQH